MSRDQSDPYSSDPNDPYGDKRYQYGNSDQSAEQSQFDSQPRYQQNSWYNSTHQQQPTRPDSQYDQMGYNSGSSPVQSDSPYYQGSREGQLSDHYGSQQQSSVYQPQGQPVRP